MNWDRRDHIDPRDVGPDYWYELEPLPGSEEAEARRRLRWWRLAFWAMLAMILLVSVLAGLHVRGIGI